MRDALPQAGATVVGNPDKQDVVAHCLQHASDGLDVVFEACGEQDTLDQGVEMLRPGGKLVIVGIPAVDVISFFPEKIRRKELTIVNIRRQRGCVQSALDMIGARQDEVNQLITHNFSFAESKEAFDLVADYQDGVVKAMIGFE